MKTLLITIILFISGTLLVEGQSTQQIVYDKKAKVYFQDGKPLTQKALSKVLLANPESADLMKMASKNMKIGYIPTYVGLGLLVAALVPVLMADFDTGIAIELLGIASSAVGLVYVYKGLGQQKQAVEAYNSSKTKGLASTLRIDMGITRNGIGIVASF